MKPEETAGKKKEGFFEKSEDNAGETAGGQSAETFKGQFQETSGKTNGETTALRGVNLSISKGEFVAVLGTNGSGKSTFARHINALHVPTEGVMLVEGMDTKEEANVWLIRQKAGMIFQNPDNQMVASIVEEDVAFGPENLGMEPEKIRMNVKEALEAVEMSAFRNATPSKLSGGQKQRIAIAGILAMRPECIILDEPTAMLDPRGRTEVVKTLQKLNQEEHMTVVYITHYMEEAVLADRVVVMDRGQVVMEGTPREIFFQVELMKQVGLDVPAMTELAWRLNRQGMNLDPAILTVEEMVNALCPSN
ncbi:MAG: energy-coupling factor transporter ATPase [Lachnospiraceae bacterium]|nr:energy-coupling factor transporter ATPase [Lachnospiraceae bacterium]